MTHSIPEDAGYYLDEFDGPKFWDHVSLHGGTDYLNDPLARLGADAGQCWEWTGWTSTGYGRINLFGNAVPAHVVGFREFGGKIPAGYDIDHLCRNVACVRFDHLEPVTHQENVNRGKRGRQGETHCRHGHEYTAENTGMQRNKGTLIRVCKACRRAHQQAATARRKAK